MSLPEHLLVTNYHVNYCYDCGEDIAFYWSSDTGKNYCQWCIELRIKESTTMRKEDDEKPSTNHI